MSFDKERFKENFGYISSDWPILSLNDVCLKAKGSVISGPFGSNISSKFFVQEGIPVIRGNNVTEDLTRFVDEGFVFVAKEKADSLNTYARENDLIFTAAGTIGQVGIITSECKYQEYIISNKQLRARVDEKVVDPLFAYYWFSCSKMNKYIKMLNTGSTIPLINLSVLRGLPIPVPSIDIQKKIVNILDSLDSKIKTNNQINKTLEAMAQTLFKHWFVDFEFPNEDGEPYKSSGGEMVESELGLIPKGLDVVMLSELGRVVTGKTPSTQETENFGCEYNFITPRDITNRCIYIIESERCLSEIGSNKLKSIIVKKNSIGVSCIGSNLGEVYINVNDGFTNQQINSLILDREEIYPYVFIKLKNMKEDFLNLASGSAVPIINKSTFSAIKIIIPCDTILDKFLIAVTMMFEGIKINLSQNAYLSEIRDTLLPKLMSGEIRVPV